MRRACLLVAVLAAIAAGCGGEGSGDTTASSRATPSTASPEQPLSPVEARGRHLFVQNCGTCHALTAAGTEGSIGPSLDEAQVDEAEVLEAIEMGGRGSGKMPRNLLSGRDARAVARFVADSGPGV